MVPNEKNSAYSAICAAISAARGTSIMVPIEVLHGDARLGDDAVGDPLGLLEGLLHLADGPGERDHDLRLDVDALLGDRAGGFHDGAHLHAVDLRVRDAEPAAAMAEHRVGLAQLLDVGDDRLEPGLLLGIDAERFEAALASR